MYKLFHKYRPAIISGLILISLIIANFTSGALKDFFLGAATGVALISFGQTLGELKSENRTDKYHKPLGNEEVAADKL